MILHTKSTNKVFPEWVYSFIHRKLLELKGLLLLISSIFITLSILSYDKTDNSFNVLSSSDSIYNICSNYGALFADLAIQYLGYTVMIVPVIFSIWSILFFTHKPIVNAWRKLSVIVLTVILLSCLSAIFCMFFVASTNGGVIGAIIISNIHRLFVHFGIANFFILSILPVFIISSVLCIIYTISLSMSHYKTIFYYCCLALKKIAPRSDENDKVEDSSAVKTLKDTIILDQEQIKKDRPLESDGNKKLSKKSGVTNKLLDSSDMHDLPDLDLLQTPQHIENHLPSTEDIDNGITRLSRVLQDFGIQGHIRGAYPGPVITLYEFEPAPGTKSSKVIGLADDIARSMSAMSTRIAVIPGKNVIGIELPNQHRKTVFLKEIFEDKEFINSNAELAIALGQTISGFNVFADLAKMPHMIVAGTTGSGKSVAVNAMILSLLYKHSPDTCKFILIDPKMLEFSMYNDIPHLLSPVVTDPKKAIFALKWTVREMENRYRLMSNLGVRNINNYNALIKKAKQEGRILTQKLQTGFDQETGSPIYEDKPINTEILPYIVVVVDEMADLMMVAGKDIESAVQRLAQMARAAGIHVIMATQRPSVDVITGTIKANFPTRVSFQVTSKFDSRTILGEQGAEQLLGRGDMLFMAGGGQIQRLHGPFVSDQEVEQVVNFLKTQGEPQYVTNITSEISDESANLFTEVGNQSENDDSLYADALEIVKNEQKASTSFIQRRLQIGYNRAARIMEQLESNGVVSTANHAGKRDILIEQND